MPRLLVSPHLRSVTVPPLILQSDLNLAERMAAAVIASHGEAAFPSVERVAKMMGCSKDTARRALKTLKEKGWLSIEARKRADGSPTSNLYALHAPNEDEASLLEALRNPRADVEAALERVCPEPPSSQSASTLPAGCGTNEQDMLTPNDSTLSKRSAPVPRALAAMLDRSPVQRLLKDYREACREVLGRDPIIFYARDGRLLKRVLESFSEELVVRMFRQFLRECQQHGRAFTIPAFFAASERLGQQQTSGRRS